MQSRILSALLLCGALLVGLAVNSTRSTAQDEQGQRHSAAWEHLALSQDGADLQGDLSSKIVQLGNDRWQLVCVTPVAKQGTTVKTVYYFKRQK